MNKPKLDDNLPRFVTSKHIQDALGISRPSFYRLKKSDPRFPKPFLRIPLRWRNTDVEAYFELDLVDGV
jgi:predicted DNA-binding transcriptional regulator AlpA